MEVAVKTFDLPDNLSAITEKEKQTLDSIRKEISTLKQLKHKNIVRLYDVKKMKDAIFMIMEYCNQKSLNEYLKSQPEITELELRYIFSQILNGFKYLRQKNVMHRDIKPENILIKNGIMKIADFGFAREYDSKVVLHSYLGTRATIAPQVIIGDYNDKCDIWSLGATLFWMCFKEYPFKGFYGSEVKLMEMMKKDCIEFPKNSNVSSQLKQMIVSMMRFNQDDRINWDELFNSPLFQTNLLIQQGLNVFDYQDEEEDDDDQYTDKLNARDLAQEFNWQLMDKSEDELEKVQEQAIVHLNKIDKKRQSDEIITKLLNRITFEKGKTSFIRQLSKKIHDYELTLSNKLIFENKKIEISDHLKALRFGCDKFEIIILRGMQEWLQIKKNESYYQCKAENNPININEQDWQFFLQQDNKDKLIKALDKDISIAKDFVLSASLKTLQQVYSFNRDAFKKLKVTEDFLSDENFTSDPNFMITFYSLCVGLVALLFPDIIKIRNNLDQLHKVLSTLVLIDDIFILLSLETIFPYSEETVINFNVFNEARRKSYSEDPHIYKTMFQRVMRTYEVFFE